MEQQEMTKEPFYDQQLFGTLLRHYRTKAGYKRPEDFAEAITKVMGYEVSKETIYRIEKGTSEPKMSLYFAIDIVLFGGQDADPIRKICDPGRWAVLIDDWENSARDDRGYLPDFVEASHWDYILKPVVYDEDIPF